MAVSAPFYQREIEELPRTRRKSHWHYQVPERTHQQRLDALKNANKIRTKRAKLKEDIKAGRESVFGHLMAPPEYIQTMKVWDLCLAKPKFGPKKVNKIFVAMRISPSKTVGGLTLRQRQELAQLFG